MSQTLEGLDWTSWRDLPAHLKSADGTILSREAVGQLWSSLGPGMGGAARGNWHIAFSNPFAAPGSCQQTNLLITNNELGQSLTDVQRHILVAHGYKHGFVVNSPPDIDAIVRPSSEWKSPPSGFVDHDDYEDSDDSDDDESPRGALPGKTFDETDEEGVSQTYHECSGRESMKDIASHFGLELEDLLKSNTDDVGEDATGETVPPKGTEVWVSIYDE